MENTETFYSISQLTIISGLTDRTIRNYIATGILQGEKVNGAWQFTAEQVENFVSHRAVRPSILAKNNAAVYDFLQDTKKTDCEVCIILDLPGKSRPEISNYFCDRISNGDFHKIRFSFDGVTKVPRVILTGNAAEILQLAKDFLEK